ncbi:hypothetical protein [Haloarchaeobius litoreus]|uniref:Peptidase MA superfamily protein n=1 Tax=Haloarchaeobius litoreus TaxID=755306 RepID=A0ABD6DLC7_9EURY|nr:hypothetical protein [Haloarchaeobius litoreus]
MTTARQLQSVAAVLVLLLVATPLVGATVVDASAASPRPDDAPATQPRSGVGGASDDGLSVRYELSPVDAADGRVRVRAQFRLSESVSRVAIAVPDGASVESVAGFHDAEDGYDYRWAQRGDASITYVVDATRFANGGLESISTQEWSFIHERAVGLATLDWWYYGEQPGSSRTLALGEDVEGWAGDDVAVVGPVTVTEEHRDGHTYRVVRPDRADGARPTDEILDLLAAADESFPVGDRGESTTVVLPPAAIRSGGLATVRRGPDRELWAHGSTEVFAHELVHVRQTFTLADGSDGPSMRWLLEGLAEYQTAVVELRAGRLSVDRFRERVTTDAHADATLADRSTGESSNVPYDKGERVVAALDAEIRLATDGERSIVDVWRLLNAHDGPVSYADFVAMVEAVAGTGMESWLDRYVRTDAAPTVPEEAPGLDTIPDEPPTALDADVAAAGGDAADPAASPADTTSVAALGVQPAVAGVLSLIAAFLSVVLGLFVVGE